MNSSAILKSYQDNGVLGELTEKSDSQLDLFFREAHREAQKLLQDARRRAAEKKQEIVVDCRRLSGVNAGEWWVVDARGGVRKELERFAKVQSQLQTGRSVDRNYQPCALLETARPLLARAAYNGLWSPSGTNWQPIRTIELSAQEAGEITGKTTEHCALMVLARRRYDSILGDIASLCGIEQTSHAEHIDLGIWLFAAQETARGHGWVFECQIFEPESKALVTQGVIRILSDRIARLAEPMRSSARDLLRSIEAADHYPYCMLFPKAGDALRIDESVPGHLVPSDFDKLVETRSTQRVASPEGKLKPEQLQKLFQYAREFVTDPAARSILFPVFSSNDPFTESVGNAIYQAVEGPEGLISKANYESLVHYLHRDLPRPSEIATWAEKAESDLETAGLNVALPARLIPMHIRAKLLKGGIYNQQGEFFFDRRERPLTPVRFVKFTRMILSSFVRYSLSFQNTHPVLGVLMTPTFPKDGPELYIAAGKIVAYMTFFSRTQGHVSIIKSGPPEIAAHAIRQLVSEHALDQTIRGRAGRCEIDPILTFQIGLALGPDDIVSKGKPEEHNGLNERLLDKRASRAALFKHYIPSVP
ncbi:MAG: hypothetical protein JXA30_16075 [Deltaproteobacteria bacterium]|nr:hypothetical protein [Deltaproteobacteria bacterium]